MSYSAPAAGVPFVEIVLPVRNEQRELTSHVMRLLGHLRAGFPYAWQVTIADNGSTDGTWSLAQALADLRGIWRLRLGLLTGSLRAPQVAGPCRQLEESTP